MRVTVPTLTRGGSEGKLGVPSVEEIIQNRGFWKSEAMSTWAIMAMFLIFCMSFKLMERILH